MNGRRKSRSRLLNGLSLHLMVWPALVLVLIFSYGSMFGLVMAFQDFIPIKGFLGSEWVGLENFREMIKLPGLPDAIRNTFFISAMEIICGQVMAILTTMLLFQMKARKLRSAIQTVIYLPHFISWVILGGILIQLLSVDTGAVNQFLNQLGLEQISFLGNAKVFPWTLILSQTWKEFGFATVVYFAALSGIDPTLYEAAEMDGAGQIRQMIHVSLPGIAPIIVLVLVLNIGSLLSAGFDQVYTLYSPAVYSTGDILDTFIYRLGLVQGRYSLATAVGICKTIVSMVFMSAAYYIAYKFADYRIF
ncbi:MAG: sugar ABC transporter permease [Roseburia sp.]|nr:sugar ABC transporter permease [Roseburia sp.]